MGLFFFGQRRQGAGLDITDAVIAWADNPTGPGVGPDNLAFLHTRGTANDVESAVIIRQGYRSKANAAIASI